MGKRLIQQARGKGSPTYRAPSHRYVGQVKYPLLKDKKVIKGEIKDIIKCPGHESPLLVLKYDNGDYGLNIAPEGVKTGDVIEIGATDKISAGNTMYLKDIPEGTSIFNIENLPGDGGKFVRSAGGFAKIISKMKNEVLVQLPSKKRKKFKGDCKATIGIIAAGGRKEKPMLKAGKKYHAMKAKNKLYPRVSGASMNAVDHPFGGSRSSRKGRATVAPKNAPPGRKVGMLRPKRVGRRKK
ncbi:50S ribosomal protein L2 [Candidatus Woesearchaeota archaeon]|nr:MAG: 50S ribosomal protein L2 [Candidatus Woesearchaeota archaeon]